MNPTQKGNWARCYGLVHHELKGKLTEPKVKPNVSRKKWAYTVGPHVREFPKLYLDTHAWRGEVSRGVRKDSKRTRGDRSDDDDEGEEQTREEEEDTVTRKPRQPRPNWVVRRCSRRAAGATTTPTR
jgi:hypothetical protein